MAFFKPRKAASPPARSRGHLDDAGTWVPPEPRGEPFRVAARKTADMEIVGESHRLQAFKELFASHADLDTYDGAEVDDVIAHLVPDPDNPNGDGHAVAVWVGGHHVGYLSRGESEVVYPVIERVTSSGKAVEVAARVWASGHGEGSARVTLHMPA